MTKKPVPATPGQRTSQIEARQSFPYEKYRDSLAWRVIEAELEALIKNNDLVATTARPYIIGALCEALDSARLLPSSEVPRTDRVKKPDR